MTVMEEDAEKREKWQDFAGDYELLDGSLITNAGWQYPNDGEPIFVYTLGWKVFMSGKKFGNYYSMLEIPDKNSMEKMIDSMNEDISRLKKERGS